MSEDDSFDDDEFAHGSIDDDLESRIEDLESKTDNLDDLESRIDDLESEIGDLKSRIEKSEGGFQKKSEKVESIERYLGGFGQTLWAIGMALSVVIS